MSGQNPDEEGLRLLLSQDFQTPFPNLLGPLPKGKPVAILILLAR